LLVLMAGAFLAPAHDLITTKLTWSAEISRIVYKRCAGCHREGGSAPMPLTSFEAAGPWAKAIRDEVISRRMPPWGAVKGFGEFREDLSLTDDEITRIAEWVEGGAPEGDPRYLPASVPPPQTLAAPQRGVAIRGTVLKKAVTVLGIRPLQDSARAKITAHTPDGVIPMLWLLNYRMKFARVFTYRDPVRLPAATRLVAEPPVRFELILR
jgi:hypothetical protein